MSTATTDTSAISMADPSIVKGVLNRSLQWFNNVGETFDSQLVRMNAGDQYLVDTIRHGFNLMNMSSIAVIIQALLGSDPTLAASILSQRAVGAQPQSGGGPGQPVSYPVQQQLPITSNAGNIAGSTGRVFVINPTTGVVTSAA